MEWWTVFFRIRKIIYGEQSSIAPQLTIEVFCFLAFIGIASFGWAITLSIYLSREWSNFTHPQRACIVISHTLVLIVLRGHCTRCHWSERYLRDSPVFDVILARTPMTPPADDNSRIVVVFRTWLDFGRALFLLVIHVGGHPFERVPVCTRLTSCDDSRCLSRGDFVQHAFLLCCFR